MPALWLTNTSKTFVNPQNKGPSTTVLKRTNMVVMQNEFFLIWGPSGTGKSTLLRMIAGLEAADSGQMHLQDHRIHLDQVDPLHPGRQNIGFVFQNNALTSNRNILDNVKMPLEYHYSWQLECPNHELELKNPVISRPAHLGPQNPHRYEELKSKIEEDATRELMKMLVSEDKHKFPHQISLGVQKRVAIARAMALNPQILLLDEPTAGLDLENRLLVLALLANISQLDGKTILMVSHDLQIARDIPYAKICVLMEGHLSSPMTYSELQAHYSRDPHFTPPFSSAIEQDPDCNFIKQRLSNFLYNAIEEIHAHTLSPTLNTK